MDTSCETWSPLERPAAWGLQLVLLHTKAQAEGARLKCARPSPFVHNLLDLTNLNSVLDIHPSLEEALESFSEDEVCADC